MLLGMLPVRPRACRSPPAAVTDRREQDLAIAS